MTKGILFWKIYTLCTMTVALGFLGCTMGNQVDDKLNLAETFMEARPDTSLVILNGIDESELRSKKSKARYALLKSMALDKNYIDTTTFDVLQPAIDYYLKNGNADERLKTLYYKGRIHRNSGDDDQAMQAYMDVWEITEPITDSLTLARLLVAQGVLFYKQYRLNEFIENNIKAAELYGMMGNGTHQLRSYSRALDGATRLRNEQKADSISSLCKDMIKNSSLVEPQVKQAVFEYLISFGDIGETSDLVSELQGESPEDFGLSLARAYSKIGNRDRALYCLEAVKISPDNILDSLTYWSVKTDILEKLGRHTDALESYRNYTRLLEDYHLQLFSNELLFSEKKHEMDMENLAMLRKRDNAIKWMLAGVIMLVIMTSLIYYRYRLNRAARLLAESNAEKLKVEGDNQRLRAENLESERARLELEAENLNHKIGELEGEQARLRELLDSQDTLSEEARELIRERIAMLNGLIAQSLTDQESYGKEFKNYIRKIRKDKKGFQESLVKVLVTTHPAFIAYLKEHGLTDRELHYACLYAIGMRGKEIGTYLELVRHYNISSDIRRKLGLDSNGENLGPFLRNMMEGKGQSKE